jgi:hypothetical protein
MSAKGKVMKRSLPPPDRPAPCRLHDPDAEEFYAPGRWSIVSRPTAGPTTSLCPEVGVDSAASLKSGAKATVARNDWNASSVFYSGLVIVGGGTQRPVESVDSKCAAQTGCRPSEPPPWEPPRQLGVLGEVGGVSDMQGGARFRDEICPANRSQWDKHGRFCRVRVKRRSR